MERTQPFQSSRNPVFYIAEIGGNHEGNFEYAQHLTRLAITSGADAVKFQFYTGDTLVSRVEGMDRNRHFKKFELTQEQNVFLLRMIAAGGCMPMASVWDRNILSWADTYLPIHKVGSGDLTCYPMLAALVSTGKPIILSTGLASMREVAAAVAYIEHLDSSYVSARKLALLQCTTAYPTPDEDANLLAMLALQQAFGLPVGYSDHTLGTKAIEVAVALGAEIIEKHFTDTREGKTFRDHQVSLTCDEIHGLFRDLQRIQTLKGAVEKSPALSECDAGHRTAFRRSIYAASDIVAGEKFTEDNLTTLRPEHGLSASRLDEILGKIARRNFKPHEVVREEDVA